MGAVFTRLYEDSLVKCTDNDRVRLQILRTPISEPPHCVPTQYNSTLLVYGSVQGTTTDIVAVVPLY